MTNPTASSVVMTCTGCEKRFRVSPARAKLGVCSNCEQSGFLNLPEPDLPKDATDNSDSSGNRSVSTEPRELLFVSERRFASVISVLSTVSMVLGCVFLLLMVALVLFAGAGGATFFAPVAAGLIVLGIFGWGFATIIQIAIDILNRLPDEQ